MFDTILLPLLLSTAQMGSGTLDSYTTGLCFSESNRIGVQVCESNPMYTVPFGDQPSPVEFALSDMVSVAAMYGIGWLIRRTPVRDWWFVPQITLIAIQLWQSKSNYNLYRKIESRTSPVTN